MKQNEEKKVHVVKPLSHSDKDQKDTLHPVKLNQCRRDVVIFVKYVIFTFI